MGERGGVGERGERGNSSVHKYVLNTFLVIQFFT